MRLIMFFTRKVINLRAHSKTLALPTFAALFLLSTITPLSAQAQSATPGQDKQNGNGKPKQDAPSDAGGPTGDIGPYTIPKKNTEAPPPPPPPPSTPKVEGLPDY